MRIQHPAMLPCPFCGRVPTIIRTDSEGNIKPEEYFDDPWSGVACHIYHPFIDDESDDCPIAHHPIESNCIESVGCLSYDTPDEAVAMWNHRCPPNSLRSE